MAVYNIVDEAPVVRWASQVTDDGRTGNIVEYKEDGDGTPTGTLIYITPASGQTTRMTMQDAVVMAQDLITKYEALVDPITRLPA